ncbi:unnamed protein product [Fusarium graminearum]|nr:unnamed protein product [Fusarium graminearum]CAG1964320.1 unnamed protein product [Fusarium graminearum]VTO84821.1 unnamed protein product [Fusarium graminearum]
MSALARVPIKNSSMLNRSVVPYHNSSLCPLDAGMEVCAPGDVLKEEVEDSVRFFLLEPDDTSCDY